MPTSAQILTYIQSEIAAGDSLGLAPFTMLAGQTPPSNTAMQWLDTTVVENPVAKMYANGTWSAEAFAPVGGDGDIERIINNETISSTGLIPVGAAQLYLFNQDLWAPITDAANNTANPQQLRDACNDILGFCSQTRDNFLDPTNSALVALLAGLESAGLVTSAQVTGFNALGATDLSPAEVQWGAGIYVTHAQIAAALGRGNG